MAMVRDKTEGDLPSCWNPLRDRGLLRLSEAILFELRIVGSGQSVALIQLFLGQVFAYLLPRVASKDGAQGHLGWTRASPMHMTQQASAPV